MQDFSNRDGKIWFNGELVDWRDANIHMLSHGLHYASSVFEGLRAYGGKPFELTRHSERLCKSAEALRFKIPYTVEELNKAVYEVMEANGLKDCYIRPTAWLGSEKMGVLPTGNKVNVAIAVWDDWIKYYSEELYENGAKLCISSWKRPPADAAPVHSKAAGLYMICSMGRVEADDRGYNDGLMLDIKGNVAEVTAGNVFFVFNGELHTPIPDCFLNGITRQTIMRLAEEEGIKVVERRIKPEELGDATEGFITGSAAEIVPIAGIEEDIKYTVVGDITKLLTEKYKKLVRGE